MIKTWIWEKRNDLISYKVNFQLSKFACYFDKSKQDVGSMWNTTWILSEESSR